jgi:hypothetical protein
MVAESPTMAPPAPISYQPIHNMNFGPWLIGLIVLSSPLFLMDNNQEKFSYVFLILFTLAIFHADKIAQATNDLTTLLNGS